jgi:hypothetical protein
MKPRLVLRLSLLPVFLALFFLTACSEKEEHQGGEDYSYSEVWAPAWPALALLKTGEHPLWFELGPDGPSHIVSPANATLTPFAPWPHARFISGMLLWDSFLVMAVNRDGFLILDGGPETTELVLYRAADSALWDPYTTESLFIWEDRPLVLLYRNDFFSGFPAPPPASQIYALDTSSPVPLAAAVPALGNITPPWEAEVLRHGSDGFWYYRIREKGGNQNETVYFRTTDLAVAGTRIPVEEWRDSDPRGLDSFGIIADDRPFSLPALPAGFAYSGVALFGNVLVASWEEQLDAGIGAAGFMVMALE